MTEQTAPVAPKKKWPYANTKMERIAKDLWAIGLILGVPVQLYAAAVRHNETEAIVFLIISIVFYMPLLVWSSIGLRRIKREWQETKLRYEVSKTVLDLFQVVKDDLTREILNELQTTQKVAAKKK